MSDKVLHIFLGFGLAIPYTVLIKYLANAHWLGAISAGAFLAGWSLIFREVGQAQAKNPHNPFDFRFGWDLWNWSERKLEETILPVAIMFTVSAFSHILLKFYINGGPL